MLPPCELLVVELGEKAQGEIGDTRICSERRAWLSAASAVIGHFTF
jgi:hypothetical protein